MYPVDMGRLQGLGDCPLAYGDNPDRLCAWCGVHLPARRRRWCSDECGRAYSDNHAWTCAREAAKERDGFRCAECGAAYPLEVHHLDPVAEHGGYEHGCQHHVGGLVTLCRAHHKAAERTRRIEDAVAWAEEQGCERPVVVEQLRFPVAA